MTVDRMVDHLFRRSAGQIVAALTRSLGTGHLDVAEEAVQDALAKALEAWRFNGPPADPGAWLFRVARNRALDLLRRDANLARKLDELRVEESDRFAALQRGDDELAMLFMCCHPSLSRETQVTLTLKTVGGFSVSEIAAALVAEPATIAQRLVRAKRSIVERGIELDMPGASERAVRTGAVLDVLLLMFNEGYAAHSGESLVRTELCTESIRLARLVCADRLTAEPAADALLALLLLQASRLDARTDAAGELVLLTAQDRSQWDRALVAEGMAAFERSMRGDTVTALHVQAAIAAAHAASPAPAGTDWRRIVDLYDQLMSIAPSSVVVLNRAVALAAVDGPEAAFPALESLRDDPAMRRYFPYHAVMGGLWLEAERPDEAARWYAGALPLAGNPAERRFVEARLKACAQHGRE